MSSKICWLLLLISAALTACQPQPFSTAQTVSRHTPTVPKVFETDATSPTTLPVPTWTFELAPTIDPSLSEQALMESRPTPADEFVYFFDGIYLEYGAINYAAVDPNCCAYPPKTLPLGVGQAAAVGFANFLDRLWFLKVDYSQESPQLQIWVSDLLGQDATQIFTNTEPSVSGLWWTPDDQHLIINMSELPGDAVIYHSQKNSLEAWPYECNRWAVSSHSDALALWCQPVLAGGDFAVIEWGGEIWLSASAPEKTLGQVGSFAWSADGERFAYWDNSQADVNLYLTDQGGRMKWSIQEPQDWGVATHKWSADGKRLLILAPGTEEKPCLPDEYNRYDNLPNPNPPCWHVYDVETGQMVWDLPDVIEVGGVGEPGIYQSHHFETASLSSDGLYLAMGVNGPDDQHRGIWVVDLNSNKIVWNFGVWVPNSIRWGPAFEADFSKGFE